MISLLKVTVIRIVEIMYITIAYAIATLGDFFKLIGLKKAGAFLKGIYFKMLAFAIELIVNSIGESSPYDDLLEASEEAAMNEFEKL